MSDTSLHHIPAPGTAAFRDVGTGANNIPALSGTPGTPNGARFLRDDGTWAAAAGDRGPEGIPNPEVGQALGNSGAAFTVPDMDDATAFTVTLTANTVTVTFPSVGSAGQVKSFTIAPKQDATGGRVWVLPGNVKWAGGAQPALSTGANKVDVFSFMCLDGTNWYGFAAGFGFA